jgi:hypothetical protein
MEGHLVPLLAVGLRRHPELHWPSSQPDENPLGSYLALGRSPTLSGPSGIASRLMGGGCIQGLGSLQVLSK